MILRIYPQNPAEREIRRVVEALERDGVVVYPTDSVYAYGCSLRSARGLERLRQLSGKQTGELSIICDGISRAAEYCRVDNAAFKILKRNLPGAITFLLDASSRMPDKALQRRKTIGVRIPDNAIPRAIVEQLGCPLITASLKSDDDAEYMTDPELIHERYGREVALVVDGDTVRSCPPRWSTSRRKSPKSCGRVRRNSTDGHNDTIQFNMNQTNFWNDAAKYGAVIGGASAVCSLLGDATGAGFFGLIGLALYIGPLLYYTRKRATSRSTREEEYGYGRRLGFIVAMALFVGVINAAYTILASRILFTDKYAELYEQSFALLSKTGLYTGEMISQMALMVQSPLWITFSSVAGQALLGLLFGLVLAALAQPRQRFDNNTEE